MDEPIDLGGSDNDFDDNTLRLERSAPPRAARWSCCWGRRSSSTSGSRVLKERQRDPKPLDRLGL